MSLLEKLHKGKQLRALADHSARASLCLKWSEESRDGWYERRAEWVAAGHTPESWGNEFKAKDLAGLEQMYSRWAVMYATLYGAGIQ